MTAKRYYYLKMEKTALDDRNIRRLRENKGADVAFTYLLLLLHSIDNGGIIEINEGDNIIDELSYLTHEPKVNIEYVLYYIQKYDLGEVGPDSVIFNYAVERIGSESDSAMRVRNFRARQKEKNEYIKNDIHKALHCNKNVTTYTESESESEQQQRDEQAFDKVVVDVLKNLVSNDDIPATLRGLRALAYDEKYGAEKVIENLNLAARSKTPIGNLIAWVRTGCKGKYQSSVKTVKNAPDGNEKKRKSANSKFKDLYR